MYWLITVASLCIHEIHWKDFTTSTALLRAIVVVFISKKML